jgi:hypothetical protein
MSLAKRASRRAWVTACVLATAMAAPPAGAVMIDPIGDFLAPYEGPANGDLDVTRVNALITGPGQVRLVGAHNAPIGTTAGAAYVWGIDRGQGTELLTVVDPPIGAGVTFDAVAVLLPDGTGFVLDLLAGTPPTPLDPGAIDIAGKTISVSLSEALLPSTGFAFSEYGYNLWPRFAPLGVDPGDNTQVSDLAPDASTFTAVVPVPAALGLQLAGLAVLGFAASRRVRWRGDALRA